MRNCQYCGTESSGEICPGCGATIKANARKMIDAIGFQNVNQWIDFVSNESRFIVSNLYEYEEESMDVIDHLLAAEEMLRAAGLDTEADQVADLIVSLRARDDELDAQADVIEED